MIRSVVFSIVLCAAMARAGVKSGHAEAELLSASDGYSAGQPVQLALKLKLDRGWHSYWLNPGDSGAPVSIDWTLPDGWVAGPLLYPVPQRFSTAGMVGYGYDDEVIMPVFLTPAEDASGEVKVRAAIDWLTCDPSACVPGEAELTLDLKDGVGDPTPEAKDIEKAYRTVPQPVDGATLQVEPGEKTLTLTITLPDDVDGEGAELIAATPNVLATQERVILGPSEEGSWKAIVPKNEYAKKTIDELEVLLTGGKLEAPLMLSWIMEN
ncbi:protein-disulfide reductase DsbD domain-containing protein [Haloferula sargassicola]